MDEYPKGALSQLASGYGAPVESAPIVGALGRTYTEPDVRALLAQHVPQDDSRDKYLALAAGFGSATKTGSFGESLGNVASALQDQKSQQEKLRAQYLPLIMQRIAFQEAQGEKALKLQMMQQELKLKQLGEKRAQSTFDMQQGIIQDGMRRMKLGQSSSAPMQTGSGSGAQQQDGGGIPGVIPGIPGGAMPPSSMLSGGEANNLEMLKLWAVGQVPGAKELFDIHKYENSPEELKPGSTYQNRTTGAREFMPLVDKGMLPDPRQPGGVMAQPGYSGVNAGIEGDKANAIESSKNRNTLLPLDRIDRMTGQPMGGTVGQAVQQAQGFGGQSGGGVPSGGIPPHLLAQVMADAQRRGVQPSGIGYNGVEQMAQPGNMQAGAISAQPAGFSGYKSATDQKIDEARGVAMAHADVVRDTTKQSDAKRYGQLTATADRALELLQSGPTASGIGSLVDSAANFVGQSTKSADAAAELATLGGWMTANVPRMEGPQSDRDVAQYKIMAAAVGDKTVPISQRIAAAKELKLLQDKYAYLNGYAAQPDKGGAPASPAVPSQSDIAAEIARRAKGK